MKSGTAFILALQLSFFASAQSQESRLQWLLPLEAEGVPVGVPGERVFHYVKQGQLYRVSDQGEAKAMPYDSVSHRGGKYWMIQKGRLSGIWHDDLGEIIPPVYENIAIADARNDRCWAFRVGKYGMAAIVNEKNKLIQPWATPGYDNLRLIGDTILEYKKGYQIEYLSQKGNRLRESAVTWMKAPEFKRLAADKYLYTHTRSGKVVADTFSNAGVFSKGLAAVAVGNQWGYISEDGVRRIKPQFQAAGPFDESGFAVVKSKEMYGLIRRSGQAAFAPKFVFLKPMAAGLYEFKEGDRIGLCDTTGAIILPAGAYSALAPAGNSAFSARFPNNKIELYDRTGTRIAIDSLVECRGEPDGEVFIAVRQQDRNTKVSGLANSKGQWVVPPVFTGMLLQYQHFILTQGKVLRPEALSGVSVDQVQTSQRIVFNREGKAALNFSVNNFLSVKDSRVAIFELNKLYGLVTPEGMLLEPAYNSIQSMGNGWFYVKRDGRWGVLRVM